MTFQPELEPYKEVIDIMSARIKRAEQQLQRGRAPESAETATISEELRPEHVNEVR